MSDGLPFIPAWLDDSDLDPVELRVYLHVCRRSNSGRPSEKGRGVCDAEVETMRKVCRVRRQTLRDALHSLVRKGLLNQTLRPGRTTQYRPTPRHPNVRGNPGTQTAGVHPLPRHPNAPDPSRLGAAEGTSEGTNGLGSPAARPSSPSRSKPSKVTTTARTDAGKVVLAEVLSKDAAWSREACDDWHEAFGGTVPGGRIGKSLKPLVGEHGWSAVRPVWQSFLGSKDSRFGVEYFAQRFGLYRDGGPADTVAGRNRAVLARFVAGEKSR